MAEGAHRAATVADAVTASPVTIVCLNDYPTMYRVFEPAGALSGGTLVSLNSGTPRGSPRGRRLGGRARPRLPRRRDHGAAALADSAGVPVAEFADIALGWFMPWSLDPAGLAEQAPNLDKGAYLGDLGTMRMNLNALEHIARASAEQGVHPAQPLLMKQLAEQAIARGHGTENRFALFEILKNPAAQAP